MVCYDVGSQCITTYSRLAKNRINLKFPVCKSYEILLFLINKCILTNYMLFEILLMYSLKTGTDLTITHSKPLTSMLLHTENALQEPYAFWQGLQRAQMQAHWLLQISKQGILQFYREISSQVGKRFYLLKFTELMMKLWRK